ncbi:response regulator transcription factor [Vibrio breoganii]|uniref:Response regulator transcription factor n=2 Tax=Vibrio breoganii TaxID=553239 RepID=A0AAP8MTW7_9VIBR|nr:response regulator transcription factor [Vibrio breoganii]NMO72018.1 response regulator transcription factor [Vibrio breoganii]NMR70549.1 response regulator transcription factor [Vibrio breoganii]OED96848.1 two-component system response regulator [Vibrio breoganii ZF-29]OEF84023.1 two-component system response regulator [Vibrio breoganii 1C10]PMF65165.1 two-component system response regulator [Vibrio breoganii]
MNTEKLQLLLVEDDLDLAKAIIDYLELEDILCDHAANGVAGFTLINQSPYDAVILDLNLPKMNGLEVCEKLRSLGIDVPILMLTARDTLDDKLTGFSKGTDDYLVKPFAMAELIVRVQALSRRKSGQTTILKVEGVELAPQTQTATRDGAELKLTPITMKLLKTLMRESPNTVSREKLMQSVWGDEKPDSNSLKVHMHNLRKAIDNRGERKLIHTIAGRGFAFKREDKI